MVSRLLTTDGGDRLSALLRLTLALVIFPHGAQKLLGWYGGFGFAGTMDFFTVTMGLPWLVGFGVILIEFFGPLVLLLGLATRLAALGIGAVMVGAALTSHVQHGFFMNWYGLQQGEGFEFHLLALALVLVLVVRGGGAWSLDRLVAPGGRRPQPATFYVHTRSATH